MSTLQELDAKSPRREQWRAKDDERQKERDARLASGGTKRVRRCSLPLCSSRAHSRASASASRAEVDERVECSTDARARAPRAGEEDARGARRAHGQDARQERRDSRQDGGASPSFSLLLLPLGPPPSSRSKTDSLLSSPLPLRPSLALSSSPPSRPQAATQDRARFEAERDARRSAEVDELARKERERVQRMSDADKEERAKKARTAEVRRLGPPCSRPTGAAVAATCSLATGS